MLRFIIVMMGALMLTGCSSMPWEEAKTNVENSKRLRVGMTKSEVLNVMGEPVSDETYCLPNVWFYYVKTEWADGLTTEDECMPLVFSGGKLAGWGNPFYTRYRLTGDERAKEVQIPTGQDQR